MTGRGSPHPPKYPCHKLVVGAALRQGALPQHQDAVRSWQVLQLVRHQYTSGLHKGPSKKTGRAMGAWSRAGRCMHRQAGVPG